MSRRAILTATVDNDNKELDLSGPYYINGNVIASSFKIGKKDVSEPVLTRHDFQELLNRLQSINNSISEDASLSNVNDALKGIIVALIDTISSKPSS